MTTDAERAREVLASVVPPSWRDGILSGKNSDWGHIRPSEAIRAMLAFTAQPQPEVEGSDSHFNCGYLIAVANIMNLHDAGTIAKDVLLQLGVQSRVLNDLDLSDYDLKPLRKLFDDIERKRQFPNATPSPSSHTEAQPEVGTYFGMTPGEALSGTFHPGDMA